LRRGPRARQGETGHPRRQCGDRTEAASRPARVRSHRAQKLLPASGQRRRPPNHRPFVQFWPLGGSRTKKVRVQLPDWAPRRAIKNRSVQDASHSFGKRIRVAASSRVRVNNVRKVIAFRSHPQPEATTRSRPAIFTRARIRRALRPPLWDTALLGSATAPQASCALERDESVGAGYPTFQALCSARSRK
jgi:hypothetical protein